MGRGGGGGWVGNSRLLNSTAPHPVASRMTLLDSTRSVCQHSQMELLVHQRRSRGEGGGGNVYVLGGGGVLSCR
jgi:hypothetical protein